jgi:small subunit ribosomal protein S20
MALFLSKPLAPLLGQAQRVPQGLSESRKDRMEVVLANTKSALKRIRQTEKRRMRNRKVRAETRTFIKQARVQIEKGELEKAQKSVAQAIRALDKAAEKGILHRNNVARRKSRLMRKLNQAMQATEA